MQIDEWLREEGLDADAEIRRATEVDFSERARLWEIEELISEPRS